MNKKNKENIDLANMRVNYEVFRELAKNEALSQYEKIGFPDNYRKGLEHIIFEDLLSKLTNLKQDQKIVLDIGPGCSELPKFLIDLCERQKHKLVFCDSEEMLSFHDDKGFLFKVSGMFPKTYEEVCKVEPKYDVILCYSVFHYIMVDTNVWDFVDHCMSLLKPGGQFLIGDIPNISKRKRFFSSESGVNYHKQFMNTNEAPEVIYNKIEMTKIDDAILMSLMMRAQAAGFDAYLLPQRKELGMSNRRDDILIVRP
ncbi:SAM-dependent methyltransferase [Candidatus Trichorickettsia mobilis]|uniref:SAM-dependent methyltransferase n=1 Tax=Candidatus Trichorickettsia mobilis TaxID=1346319 RepID=A0ABZ0UU11_9RICK|nr:class I SAM-dependent methyltransferase [Candidatus Trichorickettsia mobilis]WPY01138.1 SAM-dependent methyltransferase [Candidatus Trichorickettsia mobilis]